MFWIGPKSFRIGVWPEDRGDKIEWNGVDSPTLYHDRELMSRKNDSFRMSHRDRHGPQKQAAKLLPRSSL